MTTSTRTSPLTRSLTRSPKLARLPLVGLLLFGVFGLGPTSPLHAAEGRGGIEITPIASVLFAGTLQVDDYELGVLDIDLDSVTDFGLLVDIPINRHFQVELLYLDHQPDAEIDFGVLFPPEPLGQVEIQTLQGGVLWQGASGQLKPYLVFTGGVSNVDFALPGTNDQTGLSLSFGGGVKALFTDHFGARLDGRLFVIDLGSGGSRGNRGDCCGYENDSLTAGLLSAGLVFAF